MVEYINEGTYKASFFNYDDGTTFSKIVTFIERDYKAKIKIVHNFE
jgi:hypothetical protein